MTVRARRPLALLCAMLALLLCLTLVLLHWQNGAFSAQSAFSLKPARRAANVRISWPMGTVDVNAASAETLCSLNGVGPVLAAAILAERQAHGAFFFPEDLLCVKGIGAKTLAKLMDQLDFSAQAATQP